MNDIDTKPCPFCGGRAIVYGDEVPLMPSMKLARATCPDCGAAGGHYSKRSEAQEAWNRRAYTPSERELQEVEERDEKRRRLMGLEGRSGPVEGQ